MNNNKNCQYCPKIRQINLWTLYIKHLQFGVLNFQNKMLIWLSYCWLGITNTFSFGKKSFNSMLFKNFIQSKTFLVIFVLHNCSMIGHVHPQIGQPSLKTNNLLVTVRRLTRPVFLKTRCVPRLDSTYTSNCSCI